MSSIAPLQPNSKTDSSGDQIQPLSPLVPKNARISFQLKKPRHKSHNKSSTKKRQKFQKFINYQDDTQYNQQFDDSPTHHHKPRNFSYDRHSQHTHHDQHTQHTQHDTHLHYPLQNDPPQLVSSTNVTHTVDPLPSVPFTRKFDKSTKYHSISPQDMVDKIVSSGVFDTILTLYKTQFENHCIKDLEKDLKNSIQEYIPHEDLETDNFRQLMRQVKMLVPTQHFVSHTQNLHFNTLNTIHSFAYNRRAAVLERELPPPFMDNSNEFSSSQVPASFPFQQIALEIIELLEPLFMKYLSQESQGKSNNPES